MNESLSWIFKLKFMNNIVNIPIHFDIENNIHYLDFNDFVHFSNNINNIISEFSDTVFGEPFEYKVVILPPEDGSFLNKLGLIVLVSSGWVVNNGFGGGLIEGLTGNNLEHYGNKGGELIRDLTIGFLEKDTSEMVDLDLDNKKLIAAKNQFYEICINDKKYLGVEFSEKFSSKKITRDKFLSKVDKRMDDLQSEYKLHELVIVAPVNIKNSTQQWRTKDKITGGILNFFMEDKEFLLDYLNGKFPLKETESDDVMVVMVEYRKIYEHGTEKIIRKNAIKVFKINDNDLDKIPNDLSVEGILESVEKVENNLSEDQDSLLRLIK